MRKLMEAAGELEGQRAAIRRDLLRPSHNLPTRTLFQQVGVTASNDRTERLLRHIRAHGVWDM